MPSMGAPSRVILCALVVWLAGCLESHVVECGDGRVCPSGTTCNEERGLCLRPDQLVACVDKVDGEACVAGEQELPGTCQDGLCIVTVVECGNGIVEGGEACDDGNTDSDDHCRDDCLSDYSCGNGILDATAGEDCDCGLDDDNLPGSCLTTNSADDGADCNPDCTLHCGDGRVDLTAEACDPESPTPPPGLSCLDVGFDVGQLGCSGHCTLDIADCQRLGWSDLSVDGAAPGTPFYAVFATSEEHVLVGGQGGLYHRGADGFEAVEGSPYTQVQAIWAASPTSVFMVAWSGQIYRYDGNTYEPQLTQPDEFTPIGYMNDVWGSGPSDVYAAGRDLDHPIILRWDGDDWTTAWNGPDTADDGDHVSAVFGASASDVWAVTNHGDILRKTTGAFVDTGDNATILRMWGSATDDVWGVGLGIYHFGGSSWQLIDDVPQDTTLRAVWGSDEDNVFAVGFGGTILHYDGHAWTRMRSPTARDLFAVWGNDRGDVYAAGEFGTLLHFTGAGWSETVPSGVDTLEAVWGSDPWNVYFGGGTLGAFRLVRFDGEDFSTAVSGDPGQQTITAIHGTGANDIVAVGLGTSSTGVALRYAGVSWAEDALTWGGTDVWASGGHVAIATVFTGFDVYRYPGSGTTWSPEAVPGQTLQSVFGLSPTDIFASGLFDMLHWNGVEWTQQTTPSGYWWDLWAAASDDVWAVGDGIIHYDGSTWSQIDLGFEPDLRSVVGTGPDDVFAAGDVGLLMHWDGDGWEEIRTGTTQNIEGVWPFPEAVYLALEDGTVMRLVRTNGMSF